MTVQEFITAHKITATATSTDHNPSIDDFRGDHWRVTLHRTDPKRQMTLTFSKGYGHHGAEPTAEEVLRCLMSDANGADRSFEDWAGDYGYDTDSRKAERIYKTVVAQAKKLQQFLGADLFNEFLTYVDAE